MKQRESNGIVPLLIFAPIMPHQRKETDDLSPALRQKTGAGVVRTSF